MIVLYTNILKMFFMLSLKDDSLDEQVTVQDENTTNYGAMACLPGRRTLNQQTDQI